MPSFYFEKKMEMKRRNIFEKRINLKPYEYPELLPYKDSISHAYWLWSEFNYTSDIQDYKTGITDKERNVITKSMLSIAQIEVTVKRFWSNLYTYFPKPEIDMVGVSFGESECHVEGTEVLTPEGWKDFRDLKEDDLVIQYLPDTRQLEFVRPYEYIEKDFEGDIISFSKNTWKLKVTPDHRMVYIKNGKVEEQSAKDYWFDSKKKIPFAGTLKTSGKLEHLTDLERLYIAIQADGSGRFNRLKNGEKARRGISKGNWDYDIRVKKERKIERLKYLLETNNIEYKQYADKRGYFHSEFGLPQGVDYKQFDWVNLNEVSENWCKEFIEELTHWDGSVPKHNAKDSIATFSTINKNVADKVHAIGTLAGYLCNISVAESSNENRSTLYKINLLKNRELVGTNSAKKSTEYYKGKVYCVNVPSSYLLTRFQNTITISGNCRHLEAYAKLLELLGMNDLFDNIEQFEPLMKRVRYMETFMENKDKGKQEFILSLILFSLFVEHISLYSQFYSIQSFNKHKNLFKGISNVISATFLEEDIHGNFGIALYKILKVEHSELFTDELYQNLIEMSKLAYDTEVEIVNWIFEEGDLSFITKEEVINYVKYRYAKSFINLGLDPIHEVDEELLSKSKWFELEQYTTKETDFFNKRSTDYAKKAKSITADDLF